MTVVKPTSRVLPFSSRLVGRTTLSPTLIALRSNRRIDQQAATFQLPVGHPSVKPVVYLAYAHALLASSCGCAYAQLLHSPVEQTDRQTSSYLSAAGRSSLGQTSSQPCICPCHVGEFLQLRLAHHFCARPSCSTLCWHASKCTFMIKSSCLLALRR